MPTRGSIFGFSQILPVYADEQASLYNRINLSKYHAFNDNIIGNLKFYAAGIFAVGWRKAK